MKTTYDYFMAALKDVLSKGTKQKDIAERTGTAVQTISAFVRQRKVPGLGKQEEIALACGYSYIDFIHLGQELSDSNKHREWQQEEPGQGTRDWETSSIVAAVAQMGARAEALETKLAFWHNLFESFPSAIYLLRDGIIVRKNKLARNWHNHRAVPGQPFCTNCNTSTCGIHKLSDGICQVTAAMQKDEPTRIRVTESDGEYLFTCSPIGNDDPKSYMIIFTEISD